MSELFLVPLVLIPRTCSELAWAVPVTIRFFDNLPDSTKLVPFVPPNLEIPLPKLGKFWLSKHECHPNPWKKERQLACIYGDAWNWLPFDWEKNWPRKRSCLPELLAVRCFFSSQESWVTTGSGRKPNKMRGGWSAYSENSPASAVSVLLYQIRYC